MNPTLAWTTKIARLFKLLVLIAYPNADPYSKANVGRPVMYSENACNIKYYQ